MRRALYTDIPNMLGNRSKTLHHGRLNVFAESFLIPALFRAPKHSNSSDQTRTISQQRCERWDPCINTFLLYHTMGSPSTHLSDSVCPGSCRRGQCVAVFDAQPRQNQQRQRERKNILTRILTISDVPYSSYVPQPFTFLHAVSAEAKQVWMVGVLVIMSRASIPMRLFIVSVVSLLTIAALPRRMWRPQLTRLAVLCALIFTFTASGSDAAPPILSDRAPLSVTGDSILSNSPGSMTEVYRSSYRYVILWLGPFTVTKRSLSLAVTLAGLTFVALQSASLALITTPPERMAGAIGKAIAPLGMIGVPVHELLLTVLLALRFMATVFDEARNLCLGLASRGINWSLLGTRGTLALALRTGSRLFNNLLARSDAIANAMVARGFVGPQTHTLYLERGNSSGGSRTRSLLADLVAVALLAALAWLSLRIV